MEELYGTRYQIGSFSLINVGSGFHCLRRFFCFYRVHMHGQSKKRVVCKKGTHLARASCWRCTICVSGTLLTCAHGLTKRQGVPKKQGSVDSLASSTAIPREEHHSVVLGPLCQPFLAFYKPCEVDNFSWRKLSSAYEFCYELQPYYLYMLGYFYHFVPGPPL